MTHKEIKAFDRAVRRNHRFIRSKFKPAYARAVNATHPWHRDKKTGPADAIISALLLRKDEAS